MYGLYKDPKGEKIFITPDFRKHSKPGTTGSSQLGTVVDVQLKCSSSMQEHKEAEVNINPVTCMVTTHSRAPYMQVMELKDKETLDPSDSAKATSE